MIFMFIVALHVLARCHIRTSFKMSFLDYEQYIMQQQSLHGVLYMHVSVYMKINKY